MKAATRHSTLSSGNGSMLSISQREMARNPSPGARISTSPTAGYQTLASQVRCRCAVAETGFQAAECHASSFRWFCAAQSSYPVLLLAFFPLCHLEDNRAHSLDLQSSDGLVTSHFSTSPGNARACL